MYFFYETVKALYQIECIIYGKNQKNVFKMRFGKKYECRSIQTGLAAIPN